MATKRISDMASQPVITRAHILPFGVSTDQWLRATMEEFANNLLGGGLQGVAHDAVLNRDLSVGRHLVVTGQTTLTGLTLSGNISKTGQLVVNGTTGAKLQHNGNDQLTVGNNLATVHHDLDVVGKTLVSNSSGVKGSSTGVSNNSYFSFFESNGTTSQGYMGFGSGSNNNIQIYNNTAGDIELIPSSGVVKVSYLGTGTVYSNAGALTNTPPPSDKRLKEKFESLSYGINEVIQLYDKHYWYNYKGEKILKLGWMAQDVLPIMPKLVDESGKYLGLNIEGMAVVNQRAIAELHNDHAPRIKTIENQIKGLQDEFKTLKERP